MMYLITKLGLTNYMHIMHGASWSQIVCVKKSTVKEANKSQNHKMLTDLYIITLLSDW